MKIIALIFGGFIGLGFIVCCVFAMDRVNDFKNKK